MRKSEEIEKLIYQSVRESNLFDGEWESILVSNLLEMIITKGGEIEEFITHYSPYFDVFDMEAYFKKDLTQRYVKDSYQLLVNYILKDGEEYE